MDGDFAVDAMTLPCGIEGADLLQRIVGDLGPERIPEPHRYDDAEWVGYRITEVLPIQNLAKQKLLELDDPLARLEILEKYLSQRKLLG